MPARLTLLAAIALVSLALTNGQSSQGTFGEITVEPAFRDADLFFDQPVALAALPDGSGRLLVVEQPGRIIAVDPQTTASTVFLDIRDRVGNFRSEEGLLGIAVAPDYADSGHLFVYYSSIAAQRSVISRFTVLDGESPDSDSELIVLQVDQPEWNHNGGMLAFGPDGYLYISLGDGGRDSDRDGNGQNTGTLLGSILRIDVSASRASAPYAVPDANPFVSTAGARPEIWAYGFRNPWRFSFDASTGALYVGDVGEGEYEEIDLVVRGGNYGWNTMEGAHCFESPSCDRSGLELPIAEYTHEFGCAVTGGYVYRGARVPALTGSYIYSDFCSGRIWALAPNATDPIQIADAGALVAAFGVDLSNELYILGFDGVLRMLVGDGTPAPVTATHTAVPPVAPATVVDLPTATATPPATPSLPPEATATPKPTPLPDDEGLSMATVGVAAGLVLATVILVLLLLTNLRGPGR